MYFEIQGQRLDLPTDLSIIFQKSNILLDFDSAQCERTDEFDLPRTPNNMRVLDLANDLHQHPASAYVKRAAKMVVDGVERNGFAYISEYKADAFSCVFVCGELAQLLAIKEAGEIGEYLTPTETTIYGDVKDANLVQSQLFASPRYSHTDPEAAIRPSVLLDTLLQRCGTYWGVSVPYLDNAHRYVRLIGEEPCGVRPYTGMIHSANVQHSTIATNSVYPLDFGAAKIVDLAVGQMERYFALAPEAYNVEALKALTPLKLTFNNVPSNVRIIQLVEGSSAGYEGVVLAREPIADGTEIVLEQGDNILAVNADYYTPFTRPTDPYGYRPAAFECSISALIEDGGGELVADPDNGTTLRLKDNLPAHTFVDLLKMAAALQGKLLNYTETNGFIFDTLTPTATLYIDNVLEVGDMTRSVDGYARHNLIQFDTQDYVPANRRLMVDYVQDGAAIDEESELYTIPYCEGDLIETRNVRIDDESLDNTIIDTNIDCQYATRVTLGGKDSVLQSLLQNPVSVEIKTRMTHAKFNSIHQKMAVCWRNSLWIWREIRWESGFCTLFLVQIQ